VSTCLSLQPFLTQIVSQCAIPVFEGLLPEPHNSRILCLFFTAANWHGLAKLQAHSDLTLDVLDSVTESLSQQLQDFRDKTCPEFKTRELECEFRACVRRETRNNVINLARRQGAETTIPPIAAVNASVDVNTNDRTENETSSQPRPTSIHRNQHTLGRRSRTLNLNTYKIHSLGDYAATIRRYGTSDSYTTEIVRSHHN
jgi:hypothetical protein